MRETLRRIEGKRPRAITLRRVAAIREMASLGIWQARAARLLNISGAHMSKICSAHSIKFSPRPRYLSPLCKAIAEGYAAGLSPAAVANLVGRSPENVKVRASQMGLTANTVRDPAKFRRGYHVPADRMQEYRDLRRLGLSFEECGYELGILTRPVSSPLTADPGRAQCLKAAQERAA